VLKAPVVKRLPVHGHKKTLLFNAFGSEDNESRYCQFIWHHLRVRWSLMLLQHAGEVASIHSSSGIKMKVQELYGRVCSDFVSPTCQNMVRNVDANQVNSHVC